MEVFLSDKMDKVYSGVYKINFPNGKIYIGISNDIKRRINEHNTDFRNNLPIELAVQKYGEIKSFILLEEINPLERDLMREREKYWINFYKSNIREIGYNLSEGGDGADLGSGNCQAKISEQEYLEICDLLKNKLDMTMQEIADQYHIHISSLSKINRGHTYWHEGIDYPIRTYKMSKKMISGYKNPKARYSKDQIDEVYNLLQESNLTVFEIENKTGVKAEVIRRINSGQTYVKEDFHFPLRKLGQGSKQLNKNEVEEIYNLIQNSNKSLASIARLYNVKPKTISSINCGNTYRKREYTYPLRIK